MRRSPRAPHVLGVLAAAAAVAVAMPSSAYANQGKMTVNGIVIQDPNGCYSFHDSPLYIHNQSNGPLYVYDAPGCGGHQISIVFPDHYQESETGQSVFVR